MATTTKGASKSASKSAGKGASKSAAKDVAMTKEDKNPQGGLTDKGRAKLNAAGHNIQPGVTKKDSELTPEEMQRKGAFLRRHYANPRGSLIDAKGNPTRFALQAQAWGERTPKTEADVQKLADKGTKLLDRFHKLQGDGKATAKSATKSKGKSAAKSTSKSATKSTSKSSAKKSSVSASDKHASTTAKTNTGENH